MATRSSFPLLLRTLFAVFSLLVVFAIFAIVTISTHHLYPMLVSYAVVLALTLVTLYGLTEKYIISLSLRKRLLFQVDYRLFAPLLLTLLVLLEAGVLFALGYHL